MYQAQQLEKICFKRNWFLECSLSVCVYGILYIFGKQEFIHHTSVPREYEHTSLKNMSLSNSPPPPKYKMSTSLKMAPAIFINFNNLWKQSP
jgi:hypothetical protein